MQAEEQKGIDSDKQCLISRELNAAAAVFQNGFYQNVIKSDSPLRRQCRITQETHILLGLAV